MKRARQRKKTEEKGVWFCLQRNNAFAGELSDASGKQICLYNAGHCKFSRGRSLV